MKHLAALVIGVCLMTNGPAFGETLFWQNDDSRDAEIQECLEAKRNGVEVFVKNTDTNDAVLNTFVYLSDNAEGKPRLFSLSTLRYAGMWQISALKKRQLREITSDFPSA